MILCFPARNIRVIMRVSFQKKPRTERQEMAWPGYENDETFSVAAKSQNSTNRKNSKSRKNSRSKWARVCQGQSRRLEGPTGTRGQNARSKKQPRHLGAGRYPQLGLGVLLSTRNNSTEHQHQTKPLCDHRGSRQTQDHSIITPAFR